MTKNTTTAPETRENTPTRPEATDSLTGTLATVHQHLQTQPGATVTELAVALSLGRSTIGKALAALEQQELAVRQPSDPTDGRRAPDRWHTASMADPVQAETTEPNKPSVDDQQTCAAEPHTASVANEAEDAKRAEDAQGSESGDAPAAAAQAPKTGAESETGTVTAEQLATLRQRLRPGALREMVLEHLRAHPSEAFTATKISRAVEKSSGAIANALVTLTRQGLAEQVDERPRTYRAVATQQQ